MTATDINSPAAEEKTVIAKITEAANHVADKISSEAALSISACGYWAMFWGMNGLDKFFNRSDLGLFKWYGKDRHDQFTTYFERIGIPTEAIEGTLIFAGVVEIVAALPFLAAIALICMSAPSKRIAKMFGLGFTLTVAVFVGFSIMDVLAGDRAELKEHGLYLALMFGTLIWCRDWAARREGAA